MKKYAWAKHLRIEECTYCLHSNSQWKYRKILGNSIVNLHMSCLQCQDSLFVIAFTALKDCLHYLYRYNAGDIAGCTTKYIQACDSALKLASGQIRAQLQRALEEAQRLRGMRREDEAAWTLRRAFDTVLASHGDGGDSSPADSSPGVTEAMRRAIRAGVPLFNSGDAAGCAALYEECCRAAEPKLGGAARERVRDALAQLRALRCGGRRAGLCAVSDPSYRRQ